MTTISAQTILSSKHSQVDKTITTMLWRYPRWIHAEGRTHRLLDISEEFEILAKTPSIMECDDLSRNASSSRAIPVEKLIQDVLDDLAMPLFWGKNERGMQANEELPPHLIELAKKEWTEAAMNAIESARRIANLDPELKIGAHKQIVNRLLEPFSHITVVVTATEWSNFLWLRDHGAAEPHIHMLAEAVKAELAKPAEQILNPGEWHLPFVTDYDWMNYYADGSSNEEALEKAKKHSVACCASTSYKTVDGFEMTYDRSAALYDKLLSSETVHASPFEHQAEADQVYALDGKFRRPELHGNLKGFCQLRKMIPGEAH